VGVALNSEVAASDLIAIDTEGIFDLSVDAEDDFGNSAVVAGDAIYIADADSACTLSKRQDPEGNTLFGYALGSITEGNTATIAVKVHWGPSEDRILMGIDSNGGTKYTTDETGKPRVKIQSDTTLDEAGQIHIGIEMNVMATYDGVSLSSFYGIRARAIVSTDTTVGGNAHPTGVHGYAVIYGEIDGAEIAAGGVQIAGVKGEVYSSGATFTAYRHMCGVLATCQTHSARGAGHYAAFIAQSEDTTAANWPDSVLYAWGYYDNGIDLTGWAGAPAALENHALLLNSRGVEASGAGVTTGGDNVNNYLRVETGGVTGFVPVFTAAT